MWLTLYDLSRYNKNTAAAIRTATSKDMIIGTATLLEHSPVPQLTSFVSSPEQFDPLSIGAGLLQILFMMRNPFPHSGSEQLVIANQSDQFPSTKNFNVHQYH